MIPIDVIRRIEDVERDRTFWRSLEFAPAQYQWSANVLFDDLKRQQPKRVDFYVWDLGEEDDWATRMAECLGRGLGYPVKVSEFRLSGNGHGSAKVERL